MELSKQQKVALLQKDFLDRDQDSFVKIRRTGRLGWETSIPAGGNYSDLLRRCGGGERELIKEAYDMARDYIVAMDTPYHVTLRLSPELNCTDSRVVYLATSVFDDHQLSEGQKIDTFIGLAIHEGCHLKWTDFNVMPNANNKIVANLINLLEDERIERECGEQMPGYANYLKSAKYYMFDLYLRRKQKESTPQKLQDAVRLFNAILAIVRYPKALNKADTEEFADYLWDVREIIKDYPDTPKKVEKAANAIYEIIKDFFKDNEQSNQQGSKENRKQASGKSKEASSSQSTDGDNQTDPATEAKVNAKLKELEKQLSDMDEIAPSPRNGQKPMDEKDIAECVQKDDCQLAGICENMIDIGEGGSSVLYKAREDACEYDNSLYRIKKYIPAIAKTLRGHCTEYQVIHKGMRSGLLDTSKLAEAYQGVQTVYQKEGSVKADRIAVCVLIDESGSMYGEKIVAARDLAVLLNESIATIPTIDLYIYGHTYAERCRDSYSEGKKIAELQVYREKGFAPKKALGELQARCGNLDSVAIREASERMQRLSHYKKNLMFVITDGAPNERYETLRDTVKELERKGTNIVAVCIEPSYDPSALYTHHLTLTQMNRLAIDLGKIIKKAIMNNTRTTTL